MIYKLYNGEIEMEFTPSNHRYKVNGEYKQGVTTILNAVTAKDGLIDWAANLSANTFYDSVSDLIETRTINREDLKQCLDVAKKAHTNKKNQGADVGTEAHELIETYIKDVISEKTPSQLQSTKTPVRNVIKAFSEWEGEFSPDYVKSEQPLYSKKYDYCGTADCIAVIDNKLTMIDFKTSNPDIDRYTGVAHPYPKDFLQCSAYDVAHTEEFNTPCNQYMLAYITKSGKLYTFVSDDTSKNIEAWKSALILSRRVAELKKLI